MISNARRALPRMVFSLLLAAPGFASAADGSCGSARSSLASTRKPAPQVRKPVVRGGARASNGTDWEQSGTASWYGGDQWQGKLTASGVRYDQNALTAAHATLPIGARVRVTVTGTDHTVIVTINDRPGTRTRIIDLSRAAAQELGILALGVARVSLVRIDA